MNYSFLSATILLILITDPFGNIPIFANALRPVVGRRGDHRVNLRHGVSRVTSGHRCTLGLIFHDAT